MQLIWIWIYVHTYTELWTHAPQECCSTLYVELTPCIVLIHYTIRRCTPWTIDFSWGFWYGTLACPFTFESTKYTFSRFNECYRMVQVPCPYLSFLSKVIQILMCANSTWTRYSCLLVWLYQFLGEGRGGRGGGGGGDTFLLRGENFFLLLTELAHPLPLQKLWWSDISSIFRILWLEILTGWLALSMYIEYQSYT